MNKKQKPEYNLDPPYYEARNSPTPPTTGHIDNYIIQKSLLEKPTNCSYVYTCTDVQDQKIKVIKFIKLYEKKQERVINEISIMRSLKHPNIIQMEKYFRYGPYYCVVLPYTIHRSLMWLLVQHYNEGMPEEAASMMMKQMLDAVKFIHHNYIWHRDIKPDNFLIFDTGIKSDENNEQMIPKSFSGLPKVVLSDFGFADYFLSDQKCDKIMGTAAFMAPEMLNHQKYDNSVDIWSLGITLYVILTGRFPFYRKEWKERVKNGDLNFELLKEAKKSAEAQDLFRKMCTFNSADRITADEALKHPWILSQAKTPAEGEVAIEIGPENTYDFVPGT